MKVFNFFLKRINLFLKEVSIVKYLVSKSVLTFRFLVILEFLRIFMFSAHPKLGLFCLREAAHRFSV